MWRLCEVTVGSDAQGLLLYAPPPPGDRHIAAGLQGSEALLKHLIHNERFTTSAAYTLYKEMRIREPACGYRVEQKTSGGTRAANQLKFGL